jgi:hypothetical protein
MSLKLQVLLMLTLISLLIARLMRSFNYLSGLLKEVMVRRL